MDQYSHILRNIAERAGVPPLRQVAMLPGMKAALRVTVHYDRARAADSIVTIHQAGTQLAEVEAVYPGYFSNHPLKRRLPPDDYERLIQELQRLNFDHLDDQPDIPFYGVDVWLVERAAGGFLKGVFFAPQVATGEYARLLKTIRQYLPEICRELA